MDRNVFRARLGLIFRIALIGAGIIILFFSGIFPLEEYLARVPASGLTAAVVAADVASLTNDNRTERDLPALSINPLLTEAAQLKAADMAKHSYYAHISPDGKSPLYWLNLVGYTYLNAGENLVIDRTTSEDAVEAWMDSPDHRENILRPQFTEMGIGVAEGKYEGTRTIFVVQEFGTPYPLSVASKPAPKPVQKPVPAATPVEENEGSREAPQKVPASTLAVTPLPRTSVVTQVNILTAPTVHALAPAAYPEPSEPAASMVREHVASSTTASTSTPSSAATSTATSSASFVLAPEFFSPITVAPVPEDEVHTPAEAKNIVPFSMLGKINAYIQHISALLKSLSLISSSS